MMAETLSSTPKVWQLRNRNQQLLSWFIWLLGTALFVYCWQIVSESTTWFFVWDAPRIAADIGGRMIPPRWSYINELWEPLWDTLNIATIGTMMAIVMAIPIAFLAAKNTTPSTKFVRPLALLVIVSSRSINSLIWSLLLVSIIGPGVVAGIVAISLRSIGFIAKLLYEAIEEIDKNQVEAISAQEQADCRHLFSELSHRYFRLLPASLFSAGTLTFANPLCSVSLGQVESDCS